MTNTIEQRAEAKYPVCYLEDDGMVSNYDMNQPKREAYIAGATDQQALIDQKKITANTAPANLLKAYSTFEENAAHQSGFLIGCEWKEARIKELEEALSSLRHHPRIDPILQGIIADKLTPPNGLTPAQPLEEGDYKKAYEDLLYQVRANITYLNEKSSEYEATPHNLELTRAHFEGKAFAYKWAAYKLVKSLEWLDIV